MVLIFMGHESSFAQDKSVSSSSGKRDQANLYNDLYISYGIGTVYYFIDNEDATANSTPGTFLLGFSRSLNKIISVGFQFSYTNIGRTSNYYDYYSSYTPEPSKIVMTDNLWQGIANVRFRYLNRPSFCMYSGMGIGVTMDYYEQKLNGTETSKGQKILPAAQLTLLGFRFGRALSVFGEFGVGTNSILNAGVSYKFGDY
jgi:opacity protein-like surface antigen